MVLGSGTETKTNISDVLLSSLSRSATVRYIEPKATVKLCDMEELTTIEEVSTVVNTAMEQSIEANVFVSKVNSRGQKMATVTLVP